MWYYGRHERSFTMQETVGEMIAKAREEKGLSKRELSRLANISDTELARIESGVREVPNPKTLRKISKYIGVNYNDLMYAAGLGFQVTNLNPFLRSYYENLKGEQLEDALVNTYANIKNWENLISSLTEKINSKSFTDQEKEIIEQTIEDTQYQISTANEIVKLLLSAKVKNRRENK